MYESIAPIIKMEYTVSRDHSKKVYKPTGINRNIRISASDTVPTKDIRIRDIGICLAFFSNKLIPIFATG